MRNPRSLAKLEIIFARSAYPPSTCLSSNDRLHSVHCVDEWFCGSCRSFPGFEPAAPLLPLTRVQLAPATRLAKAGFARAFRNSCSLLIVSGVLCLLYRRSTRRTVTIEDCATPPSAPPDEPSTSVDLQLLRHLGDETAEGLSREIERFLNTFDADRKLAHSIAATGDRKQIHQIGHRLLGHSCAVHYEPLMELAEKLQSHAALLDSAELNEVLQEFDRRFDTLRKKLDALRASTARV